MILFGAESVAKAEPGVTSLPAVAVDAPKEKPRTAVRHTATPTRAARHRPTPVRGPRPNPVAAPTPTMARSPSGEGLHPAPAQAEIGNLPKAYAGGQMARGARLGMLGNRDMMDTPFNVSSYTSALIENQQARTLQDVMENDPSVRMTTPAGHMRENFRIRGFQVLGSELALNGMYGLAPDGHVPVEFLERVEVLKGPGALLNGMAPFGAIGGSINLVTKHAGETPISRISGDYTSNTQLGAHVDVARRFGDHGQFGVRYNGVYRGGETTVDGQWKQRGLNALGLDFREERFRLSLDAYHSTEDFRNGSSLIASFSGAGVAAAPSSSTNLFLGSNSRYENGAVVGRGELDITENITVFGGVGFSSNDYGGFTNGTQAQNVTPTGDYKWSIVNLRGYQNTLSSQGGLRGQFDTGPLHHQLVVSASSLSFTAGTRNTRSGQYSSNIYAPVTPPIAADPGDPTQTSQTHLASFAVADTISAFDERVQFTGGVRSQRVQTKNINPSTGQVAVVGGALNQYDRHALSPAFALIVKPWDERLSLYANYIEGLTQGDRVTDATATNYNQIFPPFKSEQIETGAKLDWGNIASTISFFEITRPTLIRTGATYDADGRQRNQGIEWNVFGEPVEGVRLTGGVAYTVGVMTRTANGLLDGTNAYGVPRWQANLYGEWDVPYLSGLTAEGRVVYTSAQYVNSANTYRLPEWARLDAGLRYATHIVETGVTFRANVTNLLDHSYWSGTFSDGFATLSAPRTVLLSATVDF
ncbi:TonB-dependent receptor [Methylosinus sp. 3S-1]|nr:TonB-dependent receptor [Methylosinus sp. 3S-1]